jgi:plastocyanin
MLWRNATNIMVVLATLAGCRSGTASYGSDPSAPVGNGPGTGFEWIRGTNTVTVGNNVFTSDYTGTAHPAVDTVALTSTMTWTWTGTGQVAHSVQSIGATTFPSSGILVGAGTTYSVQFTTPGTYQYDCAVHGQAMTGTIVVLPEQ